MDTRRLLNRVLKLENVVSPPRSEGAFTLEEMSRLLWRKDKKRFMEIAKNSTYQLFVTQFEREDAEASKNGRRFG